MQFPEKLCWKVLSYQVALGFSGCDRCVLPVVQGMPLLKRPAATSPILSLQGPLHVYPGSECGVCKKKLYTKFLETPVQSTIVGSEVVETAYLLRKECHFVSKPIGQTLHMWAPSRSTR